MRDASHAWKSEYTHVCVCVEALIVSCPGLNNTHTPPGPACLVSLVSGVLRR